MHFIRFFSPSNDAVFSGTVGTLVLADIDHVGSGDPEARERMERNANTISNLAQKIKVLISTDISHQKESIRKITVHKLIKDICERLEMVAGENHLSIDVGFNKGQLKVEAVPDQIELVFSALLENAVKYSFRGTPSKSSAIRVNFKDNNEFLEVTIQSIGCFIEADELGDDGIFSLNSRGKHSGDRGRDGTGSGLYIARTLARAHGGDITIESTLIRTTASGDPVAKTDVSVLWPVYEADEP